MWGTRESPPEASTATQRISAPGGASNGSGLRAAIGQTIRPDFDVEGNGMGHRPRRNHRSAASSIVTDTAFIANRLPWNWTLVFGCFLFAAFYWALPAYMAWHLESIDNKIVRAMLEAVFGRRGHRAEWLGIALGLICLFFAAWNVWTEYRFRRSGEQNVGLISRVIARWLD